jgi:hypothetical protein
MHAARTRIAISAAAEQGLLLFFRPDGHDGARRKSGEVGRMCSSA